MPRIFTQAEIASTTIGQYNQLTRTKQADWERAWWAAVSEPQVLLSDYLQGDYDKIDSNRRFELGE